MGALSMTGQPKYHEGMGPLVPGVQHVPYDDIAALDAAITERTAAVMLEPVQGEGGVRRRQPTSTCAARASCATSAARC